MAERADGKHIAVVAPPMSGHFQPLLALADRLAALGHRVTFVHMEDARALVPIGRVGFRAVGSGRWGPGALARYHRRLSRASGPLGLPAMIGATAEITAMLLDELPDALRAIGAEAVVSEAAEPAGALVARRLGLPFVTSHTGLPMLRELGVPPPFLGWDHRDDEHGIRRNVRGYRVADWLMRPIDRALAARGERWGLDPKEGDGFSPLLQVAQCPAGLDFPRRETPAAFRYCGPFRDEAAAEVELPDDVPLVFCSLGSLQGGRPRAFAAMARACADLGARAVIGHGGKLSPGQAAALPGRPLVRAFWPQTAVLRRSVATVTHGGFNTVLDALAEGVPMVVSPLAFEQPATAARVERAGAGRVLKGRLSARRLRAELERVIGEPSYAAAAGRLADEMAGLRGAEGAAALIDAALRPGQIPASA